MLVLGAANDIAGDQGWDHVQCAPLEFGGSDTRGEIPTVIDGVEGQSTRADAASGSRASTELDANCRISCTHCRPQRDTVHWRLIQIDGTEHRQENLDGICLVSSEVFDLSGGEHEIRVGTDQQGFCGGDLHIQYIEFVFNGTLVAPEDWEY